ncbi:uncharacterized protein LOC144715642 [Wolffia australiana]
MRALLSFFFFFLLFCFSLFTPILSLSSEAVLNDDVLGLIVFKANLRDLNYKLSSWSEDDESPCKWAGVKCDNLTGRVSELDLSGFSLSGKIGRGLLQLSSLRKLSISWNSFSGGLSIALLALPVIEEVDLSHNNLSGNVPERFFDQCGSVYSLSLAGNRFSGKIPDSLSACKAISHLNLSHNQFNGDIPSELWSMAAMESLDLSFNSLSSEIPVGINGLANLREFFLRGNGLKGSVPVDLGRCSQLTIIDLGLNFLGGELPETLRNLSSCSSLRLDGNSLTGVIRDWVGEMSALETLDLSRNRLVGEVPESLGNLKYLKELIVSENDLSGVIPKALGGCGTLKVVDFSGNNFSGELPSWVFQLGLERASMARNKLNGAIAVAPTPTPTMVVLDLSGNDFSGEIPGEIGSLYTLQVLNLSSNLLSGFIPTSLGKLSGIQVLDLSENRLSGDVPSEISQAASLKSLWLQQNALTGEIPAQIADCAALTTLVLYQNNLTGSIPDALSNLTNLQTLDLSNNQLNGSLPEWLGHLPHLLSFNISFNLISGAIPELEFFSSLPPSSLSGNPSLCGSSLNLSCPVVLPKPIVLNPKSSPSSSSTSLRQNKLILSISALVAIAAAALILIGVVAVTVINLRFRRRTNPTNFPSFPMASPPPGGDLSGGLVMFSGEVADLAARAVLSKDCELGRGGFGAVYKTHLRNGRPVAIKKLAISGIVKSQQEFSTQVRKLGELRHPNLVAMEGYFWTPSLQLLIYEFAEGGSLSRHLRDAAVPPLSWRERFNIILAMARGLAHVHGLGLVHYNMKASNVFLELGNSVGAKIGDCGLAKLLPELDRCALGGRIQSSLGYMAPEAALPGVKLTEKSDVYSFGVLVLEVVTGRRPVEYEEDDVVLLGDVVRGALEEGRVERYVDERLGGEFVVDEAVPVMKLGLICTSQVPSNRPAMDDVVNILELIGSPRDGASPDLVDIDLR